MIAKFRFIVVLYNIGGSSLECARHKRAANVAYCRFLVNRHWERSDKAGTEARSGWSRLNQCEGNSKLSYFLCDCFHKPSSYARACQKFCTTTCCTISRMLLQQKLTLGETGSRTLRSGRNRTAGVHEVLVPPARPSVGEMLPRSGGMIRARASPGKGTSGAAVGRR